MATPFYEEELTKINDDGATLEMEYCISSNLEEFRSSVSGLASFISIFTDSVDDFIETLNGFNFDVKYYNLREIYNQKIRELVNVYREKNTELR